MSRDHSPADAFLLFGATGDLARKKLFPALYELTVEGRLDVPIVGIARSEWDDEQLRERARESIRASVGDDVNEEALEALCGHIRYLAGDYTNENTWSKVAELTDGAEVPVSFLAIPPFLTATHTLWSLLMIGSFKHKGLKRLYDKDDSSKLKPDQVRKITRILSLADSAESANDLDLPGYGLHPLKGERWVTLR